VFTARYGLILYMKQISFRLKRLGCGAGGDGGDCDDDGDYQDDDYYRPFLSMQLRL